MSKAIDNIEAKEAADALIASIVIQEEQDLADALIEITEKHGKFNSDDTGVWAGYETGDENENADKGVKCANCILYEGGTSCKILATKVEPEGYCRFALIPDGVVTAAGSKSPCWDGYKQVGMKKGKNGAMVPNCVPINASVDIGDAEMEMLIDCPVCAGFCRCSVEQCDCPPTCTCPCRGAVDVIILSAASKRAPKKDRIYGSKTNKPGSADGTKKINFSSRTEKALMNKVKEHNKNTKAGRTATLAMLKAVYRRGAGAFSSSHRPGKTRDQWAMARVNAYLRLLRTGRPANPNYKQDNDLLPKNHPKSSNSAIAITASLIAADELSITLHDETEYASSEDAIIAFAEFSGLGYEAVPAFKAAWLRGVRDDENPFNRARELSIMLYDSRDSDLLPVKKIGRLA